jgi:hypothetical protein
MPPEYNDDNATSSPADHTANPDVAAESSPAFTGASQHSESPTSDTHEDGGTGSQSEETLLDAITSAADGGENADDADANDPDSDANQDGKKDADPANNGAKDEQGNADDQSGDKPEPFHKHPRWQEMVRERDTLRDQAEGLKPRAEEYDKITTFMEQNELSVQEVAEGLQVVAMMKNDPVRARGILAKRMESLDEFAGYRLPQDLQAEVNDGVISEERAQELAGLRNQTKFQSDRTEQRTQQDQQDRQRDNAQQIIQGQQAALRTWEADVQKSDPDYTRIQRFVTKELRYLVQQRPPRNNEEAVGLAKQAYKTVKDELKAVVPQRPSVAPGPTSRQSGGSSSQGQAPESFMQAIEQAANQS